MSYRPNYRGGDWLAICDVCGKKVKATELRLRWDNLMVDDRCWEPRQPQDFVRGVADWQAPPFTRPENADIFIPFHLQTSGSSSIPLLNLYVPDPLNTVVLDYYPLNYTRPLWSKFAYMAIGTGTTPPTGNGLTAEVARVQCTIIQTGPLTYTVVGVFPPNFGQGEITEAGLFDAMYDSTMISRILVSPNVYKNLGDYVTVTWYVTLY